MIGLFSKVYKNKYKLLLAIPLIIFVCSGLVLTGNKISSGEFVEKDITLKGGLMITVQTDASIDISEAEASIEQELDSSAIVKELKSFGGGRIGYSFEVGELEDRESVKTAVGNALGFKLIEGSYTIEETSSALGETFWRSTIKALGLAFLFMAFVVFFYFRKVVPSFAIVLSAVSDFVVTLAIMSVVGITLSMASVAALLMLIGYSVDSNILLSGRVLKRKRGSVFDRISRALVTGVTMSGTTLVALLTVYVFSASAILRQIMIVLVIGLMVDFMNTWIQNAGILRLWLKKKD